MKVHDMFCILLFTIAILLAIGSNTFLLKKQIEKTQASLDRIEKDLKLKQIDSGIQIQCNDCGTRWATLGFGCPNCGNKTIGALVQDYVAYPIEQTE